MPAPKRMHQITGKHAMMFLNQIEELTQDPYYKMNIRVHMALEKYIRHVRTTFMNMTWSEKSICSCQIAEMIILFLGVKSHFESVAISDQCTDSQREAARYAITEECSNVFADKLRDDYEHREWHHLKNAPINMEESVDILQAIKDKFGHAWIVNNDVRDNTDRLNPGEGSGLMDLPPIK